ncbi:MAG: metallophosphoesterase [Ectothiorhodospira sp.]
MGKVLQRLERNIRGRDFVAGDLHGMFSLLEQGLERLGFDPQTDRVISVGDLVDRGPESHRALEFLERPWFFAVRGNHEDLLLASETDPELALDWMMHNGGAWWGGLDPALQDRFRRRLRALPLAIEIDTDPGLVGVVHADVPEGMDWNRFLDALATDPRVRDHALWSRHRIGRLRDSARNTSVQGLEALLVGHTPVPEPLRDGNVWFLDTGAAQGGLLPEPCLTLAQVQPRFALHVFPSGPIPAGTPDT